MKHREVMMDKTQPPNDPGEVGWGKPPQEHRFPNEHMSRRGRPKGSKNKKKRSALVREDELALAESERVVHEGSGVTALQMVTRAQIRDAVQGKVTAQRDYLNRIDRIKQRTREEEDKLLAGWDYYVRLCDSNLNRATHEQRVALERTMLPHPDDVEVDFANRQIRIRGPINKFESREWSKMLENLCRERDKIVEYRNEVEADPANFNVQINYTWKVVRYMEVWEIIPERYRPVHLPEWPASASISWFERDPTYLRQIARRRAQRNHTSPRVNARS